MALFLFVILIAIALGLIGAVVHGLLWLLFIGIVIFLANLLLAGTRLRTRRRRPGR